MEVKETTASIISQRAFSVELDADEAVTLHRILTGVKHGSGGGDDGFCEDLLYRMHHIIGSFLDPGPPGDEDDTAPVWEVAGGAFVLHLDDRTAGKFAQVLEACGNPGEPAAIDRKFLSRLMDRIRLSFLP